MKQVLVKTKFDEKIPYMLIESFEDLADYAKILNNGVENTIARILRSHVAIERWDHMVGRNDPDNAMGAAIVTANVKGTNPLHEIGGVIGDKIKTMSDIILAGKKILVNDVGGYCPFTDGYYEIIEESEYVAKRARTYVISKNTGYINLENDPVLEKRTKDYLGGLDSHYSYICELRNYNTEELVDIFNKFQKCGGHTVYVYTTGMDVPQMYDYCKAIIESGIKKVEFEFNAGRNEKHDEVIDYLETNNVNVDIID